MRLGIWFGAVWLAACSFEPSGLPLPSLGDDDDVPIDARAIDAPPGTIDAPACLDTDNDTICNEADLCSGHDDRDDADGDETPDGCDDWDCGAVRPTVTLPVSLGAGLSIEEVRIGGGGAVAELARNATSAFAARYTWTDPNQSERDQLELGVAGGNRLGCSDPDDGVLGWTVPMGFMTGGTHRAIALTAQLVHESNCNSGQRDNGWASAAPAAPIIGYICVR